MKRAVTLSTLVFGGMLVASAHAASPEDASTTWRRVTSADGKNAVSVPCFEQDSQVAVQGSVLAAACQRGLMSYVAKFGGLSGSGIGTYAEVLASARKDPSAGKIVETTIAGYPAFTVVRPDGEPVGYGEFVDAGPGRLVSLIAYEAEPEGGSKLADAERAKAVANAQHFISSLELPAK